MSHKLILFNYEMMWLVEMQVNILLKSELMKAAASSVCLVDFLDTISNLTWPTDYTLSSKEIEYTVCINLFSLPQLNLCESQNFFYFYIPYWLVSVTGTEKKQNKFHRGNEWRKHEGMKQAWRKPQKAT